MQLPLAEARAASPRSGPASVRPATHLAAPIKPTSSKRTRVQHQQVISRQDYTSTHKSTMNRLKHSAQGALLITAYFVHCLGRQLCAIGRRLDTVSLMVPSSISADSGYQLMMTTLDVPGLGFFLHSTSVVITFYSALAMSGYVEAPYNKHPGCKSSYLVGCETQR